MRRISVTTGIVFAVIAAAAAMMTAGCTPPNEEPVKQVEATPEPLPTFPYDQLPEPEPQPASCTTATASPVDTAATNSNAAGNPEPKEGYAAAGKDARSYVVRKGDTLYSISKQFYGKPSKWRQIHQANLSTLPDPAALKIGMKLVIP